jgi:hypothetical protein
MLYPHWSVKFACVMIVASLSTGCRSPGSTGWGMPSMSSLNPWKKSNTELAQSKPSNQIPVPPAQMLAGAGAARTSTTPSTASAPYGLTATPGMPAPSTAQPTPAGYNAPAYTPPAYATPGYATAQPTARPTSTPYSAAPTPSDYGARQASATQPTGYATGPYSMSTPQGQPTGYQSNPYTNTTPGYVTADRRSDASYSQPAAGYGTAAPTPGYGTYPANGSPSGYAPAASPSPYAGSMGTSSGTPNAGVAASGADAAKSATWNAGGRNGWGTTTSAENGLRPGTTAAASGAVASEAGYRPGSTARASYSTTNGVRPASYDANNTTPTTSGIETGDSGGYPSTGAAGPSTEGSIYR